MKNIVLLGASGSIGTQTLDIIRKERESFNLIGFSVHSNYEMAIKIIEEFMPTYVSVGTESAYETLGRYINDNKLKIQLLKGIEGLEHLASIGECNLVVNSVVGMVGLRPTLSALNSGKDVALANKETLVAGGEIVMECAKRNKVNILPVDSEHSAIFQSLRGNTHESINKLILTASGGPFRNKTIEELKHVTVKDALKHPKWNMGRKISIDSATLMNKGLEVIEAKWLFDIDYDNIDVVVHPQSIVHSMVEYIDGSIIAQLSETDMRLPIQYALNYPHRKPKAINFLNLAKARTLEFYEPDFQKFPALKLAYEAGKIGKAMPLILNSANEEAVDLFLKEKISFNQIISIVNECMEKMNHNITMNINNINLLDLEIREYIRKKYNS